MSVRYVYALVRADADEDLGEGLAGERLALVARGNVAAVVGDMDEAPETSAEMLRAHDRVVRAISERTSAVLPARFGSIADDAELDALLAREGLDEALALVDGAAQMTVRLFGEPAAIADDEGAGPGTRYMKQRLRAATLPEAEPVRALVRDLVRAEKTERHDAPPLLGSLYHLVERERAGEYRARLDAASLAPLRATVSGPWPPYAFAPEALS